jgi:hypothetical protein
MLDHDLVEQNDFRDKFQLSKERWVNTNVIHEVFGGDSGWQIDLP